MKKEDKVIIMVWIIALTSFIILVGHENTIERTVENCDECNEDENCWIHTEGIKTCREITESERERNALYDSDMEYYRCHSNCNTFRARDDMILKKICDCFNKNNVSYNVDFQCNHLGICEGLSFEDKKKMAMIDDNWYCVCDETINEMYCEDILDEETGCVDIKVGDRIINKTTEFIWTY